MAHKMALSAAERDCLYTFLFPPKDDTRIEAASIPAEFAQCLAEDPTLAWENVDIQALSARLAQIPTAQLQAFIDKGHAAFNRRYKTA